MTSSSCRRAPAIAASTASGDLLVVGAYPLNGSLDQKRPGEIEHAKAITNVANVPLPEMDPVHGKSGPLMELWK